MQKTSSFLPFLLALLLAALAACASQAPGAVTSGPASTVAPSSAAQSAAPTSTANAGAAQAPTSTMTPAAAQPATPSAEANMPTLTLAATTGSIFTDPFAYCAAVGTIDTPDARFNGPHMPDVLAQGLKKASGAAADAPMEMFTTGAYWRCMDGKVYACTVGANLPCDAKANTDKTPTQAEKDFCQANPDSTFIPAAVTGHDTIYSWRCTQSQPAIDQQVFHVDKQGFIVEIWYAIPAPAK